MNIVQTYHIIKARIEQTVSKERITRIRTMAWLQSGILESRSVHLTQIASKLPGTAKKLSVADRLRCFLNNRHVRVRAWYRRLATALLCEAAQSGQPLRLLLDGTKIGNGHQLLMVALAYRRRALPIAWTWVRSTRGHSSTWKQRALLSYVHDLIPPDTRVIVCGDCEFAPVQPLVETWQWGYVLRQKGRHLWRQHDTDDWQSCDTLVTHPGQRRWLTAIHLTQAHAYPCHFLALWQPGESEPWLLATNLPTAYATQLHYARRMWIEEMFADFKRHGFDLEASRLQHFLRLSRLTLAVAMLYVMLVTWGAQTIKAGRRPLVDRNDRRDLSIFRIGLDMFVRCLTNLAHISIRPVPYFL